MTQNKQFGNVGNLGDILKHAALTSLITLLYSPGRRLLSVDTHAFLLTAPCPDPTQWLSKAERECLDYPIYRRYVERQKSASETPSRYRCSSGLALDVWHDLGKTMPTLVLAESDTNTRTRLKDQLDRERIKPHAVLDDAKKIQSVTPPEADVMYGLVDPFVLDLPLWESIRDGFSRLARSLRSNTAIVEVFTFDKTNDLIKWREAPSGFKGPLATMHRRPFHLATYATEDIAQACARTCATFGWRVEPAGADRHLHATIKQAAARLDDDAVASVLHQRRFLERVVQLAAEPHGIDVTDADAATAIRALESHLGLHRDLVRSMHWVRQRGNDAAHSFDTPINSSVAREGLGHCYQVAQWFGRRFGHGLDTGGFAAAVEPGITVASQPQENTLRRKIDAYDRVNRHQKTQIQEQKSTIENQHSKIRELQQQLGQLSGKTRPSTVSDAIPDMTPRWVYFATPSKANRIDTFDFAYNRGIVCCDVMNAIGALKPNVGRLRPGDLMLLAYGKDGVYEPKGYLTIEKPYRNPIDGTEVLHELPNDMTTQLERAGYSRDPSLGVFTGFRVTPSSVRKGQIPDMIRKPNPQQNFLRTWEDVRKANGWHKPETPL